MYKLMSKRFFLVSILVVGLVCNCFSFLVYAQDKIISISKDDFSLFDYKEKADINQEHKLSISYDTNKISLSKNDISYKIVGNQEDIDVFNDCVDLKYDIIENKIVFTGKVMKWGIYNVDLQPVIKNSLTLKQFAWWNSSYSYRRTIEIDNSYVDTDIEAFPILIRLNNSMYEDKTNHNASIRFVSIGNDSTYSFDISAWNHSGWSYIFVKIPRIYASNKTYFNMYYGNSDVTLEDNPKDTWSNGYIAVWHFQSNTTDRLMQYNLSNLGADYTVDGVVAGCYDFERQNQDRMYNPTFLDSYPGDLVIETWVLLQDDSAETGGYAVTAKSNILNTDRYIQFLTHSADAAPNKFKAFDETQDQGLDIVISTKKYVTGKWYYYCWDYDDSSNINIEVNTHEYTGTAHGIMQDGTHEHFYISTSYANSSDYCFDGLIDEIFVSNVERNATYHKLMMYNINLTPVYSISGEHVLPSPPVYSNISLTVLTGDETVCPCCTSLCYMINFTNASSFNVTLNSNYSGSWEEIQSFSHTKNGTYCFVVSSCYWYRYNYTYYFNYTFNNGVNSSNTSVYYVVTDLLGNCSSILGDSMDVTIVFDTTLLFTLVLTVLWIVFVALHFRYKNEVIVGWMQLGIMMPLTFLFGALANDFLMGYAFAGILPVASIVILLDSYGLLRSR